MGTKGRCPDGDGDGRDCVPVVFTSAEKPTNLAKASHAVRRQGEAAEGFS